MSKQNKRKSPQVVIRDRAQAEQAVSIITESMLYRRVLENQRDAEILRIQAEYQENFDARDAHILGHLEGLEEWACANPDEFVKGRKSIEFASGTLGYRTGTPKLKLLRKLTFKDLLVRLKTLALSRYIRVEESVNKEAFIEDRAIEGKEAEFQRLGVEVVQDETFFVEPNLTTPETKITQRAEAA